jgi:hypothetical protein
MNVVLLQSEAYNQLQQDTFSYIRNLLKEERAQPSFGWLDNDAAAALLNVSKRTLQNWRDDGLLEFSLVGKKIYYRLEELERMLQRHSHKAFRAVA